MVLCLIHSPCNPCSNMHISMQITWKWSSSHNIQTSETTSTYVSAYTTIFLNTKSIMASSALSLVSISNQWNNGPMNSCPFGAMYWHAQEGGLLHVQALGFGQQRSQLFASKHWQIARPGMSCVEEIHAWIFFAHMHELEELALFKLWYFNKL